MITPVVETYIKISENKEDRNERSNITNEVK